MSSSGLHPDPLQLFHPAVRQWFASSFSAPTLAQQLSWPAIARGESTLLLAPTGSGKTLAAFLWCLNRAMFSAPVPKPERCRALYISPLKALAVDVERNLRTPLEGIAQLAAARGESFYRPTLFVRTGDTSVAERGHFQRHSADILITTPESFYLLLTSSPRQLLRSIETVIVDEIHALAPTKRGAHLALSLERLEHICGHRLQRIGLSATQRPLAEIAHFLGGVESWSNANSDAVAASSSAELNSEPESAVRYRPVTVLDATTPKHLELSVQVPVEDMSRLGESAPGSSRAQSIWTSIYPELLTLIRAHQSTLIFVNNRRLAERISGALNDLAEETLVLAHHGSVAPAQRKEIEERLKSGAIKGLVATSSLELGIDMGAIDLVVQIEAPPSVSSGMQRIGRAGHHVGAASSGIIFPKFRADLLACAAATRAMSLGEVEAVRYPRNPLDVLAQQIVAAIALEPMTTSELFQLLRRAAPFASLTRETFEGVLDLLSGRYPSDEFAELRPRITWDRITNRLTPRESAQRIALVNGGTIPDRGLYGVFLAGAEKPTRLGELDEEMVFESKPGEAIILGASTWRIAEITHDRVLVSPAPGEPGKMPFWHGDGPGRPAEFGQHIGLLARELLLMPAAAAVTRLVEDHSLTVNAAENLLRFLRDQQLATGFVPSDEEILIERCRDEMGDWRICVLTPYGSRVHAPWCIAVAAELRDKFGLEPETMWADDGFVIRLPDSDTPVDPAALLPSSASIHDRVRRQLGSTALFAAHFRENAARALLLPRRRPGVRTPLWQQRKRSADLLNVASRYPSFSILLETYRECLADIFDLPALTGILRRIEHGEIAVHTVDTPNPSPFAASLLFGYVANYIYDGDAPLAERRAQALSIDQSQLQELLGDADYRELLDPAVMQEVETQLQALGSVRNADGIHDLLLRLGDLTPEELRQRCQSAEVFAETASLVAAQRVLLLDFAGEQHYVAVEHASQYRDALAVVLPDTLAPTWLAPHPEPLLQILQRYARNHGPFTLDDLLRRYQLSKPVLETALAELTRQGTLLEGGFRPGGTHREWVHPDVLQQLRRRSLARLRREVEPLEARALGIFLPRWQGVGSRRRGAPLDALLDVIETLQGIALPLSEWEHEILPARIRDYDPISLDTLMAAGELVWVGRGSLGEHDGRLALYLSESLPALLPPAELEPAPQLEGRSLRIAEFLEAEGASFFSAIHQACGAGFPGETSDALWQLAWQGIVTNDTFHSLRGFLEHQREGHIHSHKDSPRPGSPEFLKQFRSRASGGAHAQGRWSLVRSRIPHQHSVTEWSASIAQQLLLRYGLVARETAATEEIPGGLGTIYPALRLMEDRGWIRRGMFLSGLGGSQFAMNSAVEALRAQHNPSKPTVALLAAVDPANPYGALLPWPRQAPATGRDAAPLSGAAGLPDADGCTPHGMSRTSGASVLLVSGELAAYLRRGNPTLKLFLPSSQPERDEYARAAAHEIALLALRRQAERSGVLISEINGEPARQHFFGHFLEQAGFVPTPLGYQMRRPRNFQTDLEGDPKINSTGTNFFD